MRDPAGQPAQGLHVPRLGQSLLGTPPVLLLGLQRLCPFRDAALQFRRQCLGLPPRRLRGPQALVQQLYEDAVQQGNSEEQHQPQHVLGVQDPETAHRVQQEEPG